MSTTFDPNGVGISNGNLFGFPYSEKDAEIIVIPVSWDVTASFGKGTANAPESILEASTQLDFFHPELKNAYETKIHLLPINKQWKAINDELTQKSIQYIDFLEDGGDISKSKTFQKLVAGINLAQKNLKDEIQQLATKYRKLGKIVAVLGGEHSTPLGLIESIAKEEEFGVLQIDAHADLRNAYEGFEQSHASIMHNVLKLPNVSKLVQVGIRDLSQEEANVIAENERIVTFYDWDIKSQMYSGKSWADQCLEIIAKLPEKVYISFDIDGLKPYLCPNTGTPVPGGFELDEISFLIFKIVKAGKQIVGFDLNEVGNEDWDANVGARALWQLAIATKISLLNTI